MNNYLVPAFLKGFCESSHETRFGPAPQPAARTQALSARDAVAIPVVQHPLSSCRTTPTQPTCEHSVLAQSGGRVDSSGLLLPKMTVGDDENLLPLGELLEVEDQKSTVGDCEEKPSKKRQVNTCGTGADGIYASVELKQGYAEVWRSIWGESEKDEDWFFGDLDEKKKER
ncbi:unnamed protein product, partial [Amoebophrya sp. A120]|eukprot:GSA120T00025122001.1